MDPDGIFGVEFLDAVERYEKKDAETLKMLAEYISTGAAIDPLRVDLSGALWLRCSEPGWVKSLNDYSQDKGYLAGARKVAVCTHELEEYTLLLLTVMALDGLCTEWLDALPGFRAAKSKCDALNIKVVWEKLSRVLCYAAERRPPSEEVAHDISDLRTDFAAAQILEELYAIDPTVREKFVSFCTGQPHAIGIEVNWLPIELPLAHTCSNSVDFPLAYLSVSPQEAARMLLDAINSVGSEFTHL